MPSRSNRRFLMRFVVLVGVSLLQAGSLSAQVMPATRRAGAVPADASMSDGEPISYILEHADSLDLTDPQRTALMNIRRMLRRANDPFMQRLDSLRELAGVSLDPRRRDSEDRSRMARLDSISKPITDSIRANNDAANIQARAVLDSAQRVVLDAIVADERGGRDGRGGRRGRPPR